MNKTRSRRWCAALLMLGSAAFANAQNGDDWQGGHDNDVVSIGHDATLPAGHQARSVVSILGSSSTAGDAVDTVSIIGDTRVTGSLQANAVSVLGTTTINGKVDGNAVALLGNVELGPDAVIGGDVVALLGSVRRDPAAIVRGDEHSILGDAFGGVSWLRLWITHCLLLGRPLALLPELTWAWGLALGFLAFYFCLALLFPDGMRRCVQTFDARPGHALLAAIIGVLLTPVLIVLLCVTVIGIAAVPFVATALLCAGLFGRAVMLAWLGGRVTGRPTAGPLKHPAVAVLAGGALVLLLYLVPVLGFLLYQLIGVLGFGAVLYTLIVVAREQQAAKAETAAYAGRVAAPASGAGASGAGAGPAASGVGTGPAASGMGAGASGAGTATSGRAAAMGFGAAGTAAIDGGTAASGGGTAASSTGAGGAGSAASNGPAAASGAGPSLSATTPSGVAPLATAAMPRAGFWIRMAALLLDVLLVGFLTHLLRHVFHLQLVLLAVYGAVMWKLRGSTLGGIVLDLQVVRLDGRPVDWETAIVRALGCFLSLAVVGLGFIWIAFDGAKQAWHDKIAGTVVVRVPKAVPPAVGPG